MSELTNAEVLAKGLKGFELQEDFVQEQIADYIGCPSVNPCNYDGGSDHSSGVLQMVGRDTVLTLAADKLEEYTKAQQDGRLVKLPCKVGDTVYMVQQVGSVHWEQDKYIIDDEGTPKVYEKKFDLILLEYIGKTVFLTRAEAESALKSANPPQMM